MAYPSQLEFIGEDVVCLSQKQYDTSFREWTDNHPAMRLVMPLPASAERDLIEHAVRRELY